MSQRPIDPSDVRARVLRELAELPLETHLEALKAIDHGHVEIDLSEPGVVRIVVAERLTIEVPVEEWHDP
jgi:hypothetical protein